MTKQTTPIWHRRLVTVFGAFGYLSTTLQWLWVILLLLPSLLDSSLKDILLPKVSQQPTTPQFHFDSSSLITIIIGAVVTFVVLVVTAVVIVRLPLGIAKAGHRVTEETADVLIPLLTHHKKVSAKKRRILRLAIGKVSKLILLVLPVLLLNLTLVVHVPLASDIIFVVGCFMAICSLGWFSLEYIVARLLNLPAEMII